MVYLCSVTVAKEAEEGVIRNVLKAFKRGNCTTTPASRYSNTVLQRRGEMFMIEDKFGCPTNKQLNKQNELIDFVMSVYSLWGGAKPL